MKGKDILQFIDEYTGDPSPGRLDYVKRALQGKNILQKHSDPVTIEAAAWAIYVYTSCIYGTLAGVKLFINNKRDLFETMHPDRTPINILKLILDSPEKKTVDSVMIEKVTGLLTVRFKKGHTLQSELKTDVDVNYDTFKVRDLVMIDGAFLRELGHTIKEAQKYQYA